mgnify:CR=1 FL=1
MTIKIILVDDHELFRSGLKSILQSESDFEIIGEASDGLSGVKLVSELKPDLVLLDLDMPVMHGKEALAQILADNAEQAVIMLTVSEDGADLADCMRIGARGYLLKNINIDFLTAAIRRGVDGDSVLSPEMTSKLVARLRSPETPSYPKEIDTLTPRERETLKWLATGVSNKHIARYMDVAESTIKVHVQSILRKLNLISRVQAAVFAVEHGLDK